MPAFNIKVFKDGKLHYKSKAIAPSSFDLRDSLEERYFPCGVSVLCDRSKQPKEEARYAN